jgi:uncharacterized repeat protein (TIGR04138 family)
MHEPTFEEELDRIVVKDPRFHRDAYLFVREALDHTRKVVERPGRNRVRQTVGQHVTGQELLAGIRDYALSQYGPMAITVLEEWGVHQCRDFGDIVFNMVEASLLAKTEDDNRSDFEGGYDFDVAFRQPFLPSGKLETEKKLSRPKLKSPKISS